MTPTAGEHGVDGGAGRGGLGIFGGTFDPPHVAHVAAAAWVRSAMDLETVLFVVAGDPWQKSRLGTITPAADRLAMVEAACDGVQGVEACDLETRRAGPSYTIDTLEALSGTGKRLVLVIGADAVDNLPTWHRFESLPAIAELAIVDRGAVEAPKGFVPESASFVTHRFALPRLDVSSTLIRQRLAAGLAVDGLVPPAVLSCISARGLYRGRP